MRVLHQYTSALVSLYTGATHREQVLTRWRGIFAQAQAEGAQCQLEQNAMFNPGHTVLRQVPDPRCAATSCAATTARPGWWCAGCSSPTSRSTG